MPRFSERMSPRRLGLYAASAVLVAGLAAGAVAMYRPGALRGAPPVQTADAAVAHAAARSFPQAPDADFTTPAGATLSIARFRGKPTMLWLLSTWCGSCAAGLQTMAAHESELQAAGLQVIVLRNYQNAGYPGPDVEAFVRRLLPNFNVPKNWILGQASESLDKAYNARHYPDIYFLVDRQGRIQVINGAPSATLEKIVNFARAQASGGA